MEDLPRVSVIQARRRSVQAVNLEEEEEDEEKEEGGGEEKVECPICGEVTSEQLHYGGLACPSCKAFFRRTVALHRSLFVSIHSQTLPRNSYIPRDL